METKTLKLKDLALLLGAKENDLSACQTLINQFDFRYKLFNQRERETIFLDILKIIESSNLLPAGPPQKKDWEKRWLSILEKFVASGYSLDRLIPDFFQRIRPIRIGRDFGRPLDQNFELNLYTVFRRWLFQKYLNKSRVIYEFACGTAFNLVELAKLFPDKELHGLDWVYPPKEIIAILAKKYGYKITGHTFDVADPNPNFPIDPEGAILTINGLEQLGTNFESFLQFVLKKSPRLCVQVEPLEELYDTNQLPDYLALKFNYKRHYLSGYLTRLRQLEKKGRIKIIQVHKMPCGLYHEGHSFVVWKPITPLK